jgi:hypothetical protein
MQRVRGGGLHQKVVELKRVIVHLDSAGIADDFKC